MGSGQGAKKFLSTPSARRATWPWTASAVLPADFYPRPPRGGRQTCFLKKLAHSQFLSTPSARRATARREPLKGAANISIHALREEGDESAVQEFIIGKISIHALREEGDRGVQRGQQQQGDFYPRPPRGGRPAAIDTKIHKMLFLSTPSARRATCPSGSYSHKHDISIHALREEGDTSRL